MSQPNYQKLPIEKLVTGMWICRLDKDQDEQPFETRGFYFTEMSELLSLEPKCRYVYIDTNRKDTRKLYLNLNKQMASVFADLRLGKALDTQLVTSCLDSLMQGVLHDAKSMVYLAMLREHEDFLVVKSVAVAVLSLVFARHLGVKKNDLIPLGMGALLHPLGLIKVPASILNKPQALTQTELEQVRNYPLLGFQLLQTNPDLSSLTQNIVLQHQERIDGSGYPHKLRGRQIEFLARLVAITSVYEALTRDRKDRPAISATKALSQLYRWRFESFDNLLVEKFIQSLGVYPPGCLVELNNGALAVVYATQNNHRLSPKVRLLTDAQLHPLEEQEPLDLALHKDLSIVKTLNPEEPRFIKLLNKLSGN